MVTKDFRKEGYFIRRRCEGLGFNPPKELENGKIYEILYEEDTFFGPQLVIRLGRKTVSIPKKCIISKSGIIKIAMIDENLVLDQENEVFLMKITRTRVTSNEVIIVPVMEFVVTDKVKVGLCENGDLYFLLDKRVQSRPFGYVGRTFAGPPVKGERFIFKSVIPFSWSNNRTRWWNSIIIINSVEFAKEIGMNFYKIIGKTTNNKGHTFRITAYVSL